MLLRVLRMAVMPISVVRLLSQWAARKPSASVCMLILQVQDLRSAASRKVASPWSAVSLTS
jgi:hypothetical protein